MYKYEKYKYLKKMHIINKDNDNKKEQEKNT